MKAEENRETKRLREAREAKAPWRKWGPYLSERQWGTVREDYTHNGDAWNYFTHDQARSPPIIGARTALLGLSDDRQLLCFALALWNGDRNWNFSADAQLSAIVNRPTRPATPLRP